MRARLLIGALTGVFLIALAAGCGDSGGGGDGNGGKGGGAASPASAFDWPYFGRVPERTHYVEKAPTPPFIRTRFSRRASPPGATPAS